MMMKKLLLPLLVLALVPSALGWCAIWNEGGTMKFCRDKGKKNCDRVQSAAACVNLSEDEDFVSGYAYGDEVQCTLHTKKDCTGSFFSAEHDGWKEFPLKPKSFTCPCYAKAKTEDS